MKKILRDKIKKINKSKNDKKINHKNEYYILYNK
jgi:hypothetical protein